ncbi:hypothetical protein GOD35_15615 [Sinorhizobium medicae]|nr:hypothetical protein [Sinorhizobium medicae]MDX0633671.1 hypothetical protein [Sinorhizobium medicae]MDX0904034.1 hypothetical protein [Sinorhizobium medicae]MDX1161943.1 hypothetical protein [Sinorhizobium medicae]
MKLTPKTRIVAATAVSLLCSGTVVQAQDMKKYGTAAGWDIIVRGDMGPGCLIAKKLGDDMQVLMGIDETTGRRGYMALYTKLAANVGSGEKRSVLFDVDGQKFSGEATGQQLEGFDGAYVWVNNPDFIYDLAKMKTLTITPEGRKPFALSLAGTDAAMQAMRACQEAN